MATNLELKASACVHQGCPGQAAALGGVSKERFFSATHISAYPGPFEAAGVRRVGSELIYYERDEVAPERWSHM